MKVLYWIALVLAVVGAVNWGLVALLDFDLVEYLCVELIGSELTAKIVYTVVAVAGIYVFVASLCCCKCCCGDGCNCGDDCKCEDGKCKC